MRPSLIVRLGGARAVSAFVAVLLTLLAVMLALPVTAAVQAAARSHPTVEIHDDANVLQGDVTQSIENLSFFKGVHVVVLTVPGQVTNLNDAVLEYARTRPTDVPWISRTSPRYWASGLVILAVAPQARYVGCYFGEDVKVGLEEQAEIQDVAKSDLRSGNWDAGMVAMARQSAHLLGRTQRNVYNAVAAAVSLGGLVGLALYLRRGSQARSRNAQARRSYSTVTHDYDTTELLAETLPPSEPHSAQVLARYDWFVQEYEEVSLGFADLGEPRGAQWYTGKVARATAELARRSATLDSLDDVIAHASALLTMSSTWEDAWRTETGPVREDLASLQSLADKVARTSSLDVTQVRTWVRTQSRWLAQMTVELGKRTISPSRALSELDRISEQTRTTAERLARDALAADTSRYAKERRRRYERSQASATMEPYSGRWSLGGMNGVYRPHSTIRLNPSSPGLGAGDGFGYAVGSTPTSSSISNLVVGYSSAATYTPSSGSGDSFSGSGSSSSYSSGGFSGAGSSSSF